MAKIETADNLKIWGRKHPKNLICKTDWVRKVVLAFPEFLCLKWIYHYSYIPGLDFGLGFMLHLSIGMKVIGGAEDGVDEWWCNLLFLDPQNHSNETSILKIKASRSFKCDVYK